MHYLVIIASENVVLLSSKCSQEEVSSVKKRESARVTAGTASIRKLERLGKLQQQLKEGGSRGARGPSLNRL